MPLSLDDLRARARPWTEPISADSPAGSSAWQDPACEAVLREVARLDSVSGGAVDWKQVVAVTMFLVALGALLRFGDLRLAARLPQASAPRGERGGADARPSSPPVESVSGDSAGR